MYTHGLEIPFKTFEKECLWDMEQLSVGRDQKAASAPSSFLVDHSYPPMTMKWIKGGKPLHLFWDISTGEAHEH